MPFYVFACETCKALETIFSHKSDGGGLRYCVGTDEKPHEEAQMNRDYMAESRRHIPSSAFPMTIRHFTGEPIVVNSESERQALAKMHNLTPRDDAAYEEQEWVQVKDYEHPREYTTVINGEEIHVSKPGIKNVMKEGSGMGNKRSWVGVPKLVFASKEEIEEFYRGR